jgi:polar amino acid transport system permease protein
MPDNRDNAPRSATLPGSAQPAEASKLAGIDRWWLLFLAAVGIAALLWIRSPEFFRPMMKFIIGTFTDGDGVYMTLKLTVVSFVFILIVGMVMGLCRVSSSWVLKGVSSLYVEIVRGVPVLVWLLWIYFGIPVLLQAMTWLPESLQRIDPFAAAVIAFTFAYGAYMTEVFRAGIQSISKGQMEASRSLGMNYIQAMRHVVLPQAVRVILPPVSNEFVTLLKDSSLVSILGLEDITRRGREWVSIHFTSFGTYLVVALFYLILTLLFSRISTALERRLSVEKR